VLLFQGIVGLAAAALAGLAVYAFLIEPDRLVVERVRLPVPGLPPHLDGFTIGVISDLHLGPFVPARRIRRAAGVLARARPDLTIVAGDFVSAPEAVAQLPEALAPLKRPVGVLGNWDWRVPAMRTQTIVRLLINDGFEAAPGLWVAGVDDSRRGRPDIDAAMAKAPKSAIRILIAHEPEVADRVRPDHRVALQISGHSHGGQVRLPLIGPLLLPRLGRKYHTGLSAGPACPVYTTRGVGMVHLPVRFLCPPEVTLITLTTQRPPGRGSAAADPPPQP